MERAFVSILVFVTLSLITSFVSVEADCKSNEKQNDCGKCVSDIECYYCIKPDTGGNSSCIKSWNPKGCDDFYVLTCSVDGVIWVSLAGAGAGIVLLFIVGCIIYCCCCRGKAKRQRQFEMREREDVVRRRDMKEKQDSRKAERKAKNDAIRKKYGLYKDDDEDKPDSPFSSTGTSGRYQRFD